MVLFWKKKSVIEPKVGLCPWTRQEGTSIPHVGSCKINAFFHAGAFCFLWPIVKISLLLPAMMILVTPQRCSLCLRGCDTNQESMGRGIFVISTPSRAKAVFKRDNMKINRSALFVL